MKNLREKYIEFFTTLIDMALSGKRPIAHFCDDIVLELYLDGNELHWRKVNGGDSSHEERDG